MECTVGDVSQCDGNRAAAHAGADSEPDRVVRPERKEPQYDRQSDHHPIVLEETSTPTV
jgi:hypothetical protein